MPDKPDEARTGEEEVPALTLADEIQLLAESLQEDAEERIADSGITSTADVLESDASWLPDWYMKHLGAIEDEEARITEAYEVRMRQLNNYRRALTWRWGPRIRRVIDFMLGKQKTRTIVTGYGKMGKRSLAEKLVIEDHDAAKRWVVDAAKKGNAALASSLEVKIQRTTPLKDHTLATGEVIPGTNLLPKRDKFFVGQGEPWVDTEGWEAVEGQKGQDDDG